MATPGKARCSAAKLLVDCVFDDSRLTGTRRPRAKIRRCRWKPKTACLGQRPGRTGRASISSRTLEHDRRPWRPLLTRPARLAPSSTPPSAPWAQTRHAPVRARHLCAEAERGTHEKHQPWTVPAVDPRTESRKTSPSDACVSSPAGRAASATRQPPDVHRKPGFQRCAVWLTVPLALEPPRAHK